MEVGPGIATPLNVQRLQTASHAKAKENPSVRFYARYDKVYRTDVLQYVYACYKANQGAAGVDEERFELHENPVYDREHTTAMLP
jgi:RNA-directed DNA polymerase